MAKNLYVLRVNLAESNECYLLIVLGALNNGIGDFMNLVERRPTNYSPSRVLRVFQHIGYTYRFFHEQSFAQSFRFDIFLE